MTARDIVLLTFIFGKNDSPSLRTPGESEYKGYFGTRHSEGSRDRGGKVATRGERAEQIANWYFRLNGFFQIPGFVVHPDRRQRFPRTEADFLGVRLPHSVEEIAGRAMADDLALAGLTTTRTQTLLVLVEVKAGECNINGPWSDRNEQNMQRVIRRLGFADSVWVDAIAASMYDGLRWEDTSHVLQYIAVGARSNRQLQNRFPRLAQITWERIGTFLHERFRNFPEKLPDGAAFHPQWPDFGRSYCEAFPHLNDAAESVAALNRYLDTEHCR